MEARARAAVARLQELSQQQAAAPAADESEVTATEEAVESVAAPAKRVIAVDEAETISRTLLLAQRTADQTLAEAEAAAEDRIADAEAEATKIIEDAKAESRRAGEAERVRVEGEVQALLARRDFLESDVDQLDQHLQAQRERITEVVAELSSITNRVPNGLAPMRRPQLSASDHSGEQDRPVAEERRRRADDEDDIDVVVPDRSGAGGRRHDQPRRRARRAPRPVQQRGKLSQPAAWPGARQPSMERRRLVGGGTAAVLGALAAGRCTASASQSSRRSRRPTVVEGCSFTYQDPSE